MSCDLSFCSCSDMWEGERWDWGLGSQPTPGQVCRRCLLILGRGAPASLPLPRLVLPPRQNPMQAPFHLLAPFSFLMLDETSPILFDTICFCFTLSHWETIKKLHVGSILKMKHYWSKYLYQYHYSHWRLSSAQGRGWTRRSRRWRRPHRRRRRHLCCRWRRRRRRLRNHRESGRIVPGSAKGIIWLTGESHTNITLETFSFSLSFKIFKNASFSTTSDHPFKVIKMINMPLPVSICLCLIKVNHLMLWWWQLASPMCTTTF